jgi:hypothetical protein
LIQIIAQKFKLTPINNKSMELIASKIHIQMI